VLPLVVSIDCDLSDDIEINSLDVVPTPSTSNSADNADTEVQPVHTSNISEEANAVTYDFSSLPKSMYMTKSAPPPVEVSLRGPTSVNEMIKLKEATRARLRRQKGLQQRDKGRSDLFTNPDKYIALSDDVEASSEEVLFLESFKNASRKSDLTDAGDKSAGSPSQKSPKKSPRKSPRKIPQKRLRNDIVDRPGSSHQLLSAPGGVAGVPTSPMRKTKTRPFIPPGPKPLPSLSKPKSPPKPRSDVFMLPAQRFPSPRQLSTSPRLMAVMSSFRNIAVDDLGYSSFSDADDDDVNPEHVQMAKQLEREERRARDEEAKYQIYMKIMESFTSDEIASELQIQTPQANGTDSWLRAKKAHEKIVPKLTLDETKKLATMQEEWNKLEVEKNNENMTIQRGTGKYILEKLFGEKKKKFKKKAKNGGNIDMTDGNRQSNDNKGGKGKGEYAPLDPSLYQEYKYEVGKVEEVKDLVDVVSLPSSYQGSTPPPSPRSLHSSIHGGVEKKKKKKKKKSKKQIEEEKKKLREENDEFMAQRRKDRERLMLDFSKLKVNIPARGR